MIPTLQKRFIKMRWQSTATAPGYWQALDIQHLWTAKPILPARILNQPFQNQMAEVRRYTMPLQEQTVTIAGIAEF